MEIPGGERGRRRRGRRREERGEGGGGGGGRFGEKRVIGDEEKWVWCGIELITLMRILFKSISFEC